MDFHVNPDFLPIKTLYFLFMAGFACMIPYLPVYFYDLGLEVWQIGIMRGLEPVVVFLLSPVWGAVADKFGKHKPALIIALFGSGVFYFCLLFVPLISSQFTATEVSSVPVPEMSSEIHDCSPRSILELPFLESSDIGGVCDEICQGVAQSSNLPSDVDENYICFRMPTNWKCSTCPSSDGPTMRNGALSGPTNISVLMRICEPLEQELVTYSPLKGVRDDSSASVRDDDCATSTPCQCEIISNIDTTSSQRIKFSLCFLLVILSVVFNCNILAFLDAVLMQKLGPANRKDYGKHRMWGAVGWGVMAFLSGYANDLFTHLTNSTSTRYEPLFVIFLMCMMIAVVVAVAMKFPEHERPQKMHQDLLQLLKCPKVLLFLFVLVVEGISFGMSLSFVLLYLTKVLGASHTLMGLAILVSTLTEIPVLFTSGWVIRAIRYEGVVYTTLAAYALRFIGYAFISNPWWVLPFQALHGITFGLGWPGFTHFAITSAPKGMAATLQAIMLGMYIGVGVAIGNFFGGFIVAAVGYQKLFWVNVGLLIITGIVFFIVDQCFIKRQSGTSEEDETKPAENHKGEEVKVHLNGQSPTEKNKTEDQPEGETMLNEKETSKV